MLFNDSIAEVFPCGCDPAKCSYKKQWIDCGKPYLIRSDVALGKVYLEGVSEWLKANYCIQKSYVRSHSEI